MVHNITALTYSGVRDWLIQRVSAIVLAVYTIFLLAYVVFHPHMSFSIWHDLFEHTIMRVLTVVVFLNLILHTWVGVWTILTDYVKVFSLRLIVEVLVILTLISYFIWSIKIFWG